MSSNRKKIKIETKITIYKYQPPPKKKMKTELKIFSFEMVRNILQKKNGKLKYYIVTCCSCE